MKWYDQRRARRQARFRLLVPSPGRIRAWGKLTAYLGQGLLLVLMLPFFLCGQAFREHLLEKIRHRLIRRLMPAV